MSLTVEEMEKEADWKNKENDRLWGVLNGLHVQYHGRGRPPLIIGLGELESRPYNQEAIGFYGGGYPED